MRQQIDCAVLNLVKHHVWVEDVFKRAEHALSRIRIHRLDWEQGEDPPDRVEQGVALDVQSIAKASVSLRRFDVCLIPVSLETLGWTRQALAAIPRGPFLPLIGLFNELRSAAMQDLLELGLADFVRMPLCPDEFRARILCTVSRVPRPGSLRESDSQATGYERFHNLRSDVALTALHPRSMQNSTARPLSLEALKPAPRATRTGSVRQSPGQAGYSRGKRLAEVENTSFRSSKSFIVEQFERGYITEALERHGGNIAMAARASNKHRRAFWALMRKYKIDAAHYRPDEDAE